MSHPPRPPARSDRRGMVLPLILLVLVLLGMLAASSSFYIHADLSATRSISHRLQTRLAAEAGLQKVMLLLRTESANVDAWYHNPDEFHRVIVWSDGADEDVLGTTEELDEGTAAYRFSIVADDPQDDEKKVRFGITDESGKLNINVATREQLAALISPLATQEMNVDELVDALIDWRDPDHQPSPNGAEAKYYAELDPPYAVKNAPFDTVEELLLVRGFTGELLYGEDYDRNGLLSPNEDDGDERFPPDNNDGRLNRGLFPYITVYSQERNAASDNKPRIYLFGDQASVLQQLAEFVDSDEKLAFIGGVSRGKPRIASPAGLLRPRQEKDREVPSPLTEDDLGWIMDRLTTSREQELVGLININTAPAPVLATLSDLTVEEIDEIVAQRALLEPEEKRSTAWLASIVGLDRFEQIAPKITTHGMRYRVESIGYADHVGTMTRLETIIEMRGPLAQTVYYRDLTTLGTAYPIRVTAEELDVGRTND
ncbi:MAG: general secretion pathway protein GspK [Planctomycetes bacterium]|nr:general secretion pathway protein GspK [Planctomycetota bacterium]